MDATLLLASSEGLPPEHIAAQLAFPLGVLIFGGAVFALLWSNYGAKKGALIYGTAFFGFAFVLGVFFWFGAPGTPVATGPQNFPGQAPDEYQPAWYAFEPGSPRADFFPATNDLGEFETPAEFVGTSDEADPMLSAVSGDLDSASSLMVEQYFPTNEAGALAIGANRRSALQEAAGQPQEGETRADPFYSPRVEEVRVALDQGQRVALGMLAIDATFVDAETGEITRTVTVSEGDPWFAFKEPGAIWLPSAVWTIVSFLFMALCLLGLDRLEMRDKREATEAEQAEDLEVPIAQ